ncbi:hypothetical protein MHYP_G00164460 [Metynnis hypsauchen]
MCSHLQPLHPNRQDYPPDDVRSCRQEWRFPGLYWLCLQWPVCGADSNKSLQEVSGWAVKVKRTAAQVSSKRHDGGKGSGET